MNHWLRNSIATVLGGVLAVGSLARPASAATPAQVNDAINKAKAYIYTQMKGDNWEEGPRKGDGQADINGAQWGGTTAMAVYGLLAAGENPQNPKLKSAIEWLKKAPIGGHYANGIRAQVWTFLKDEREAKLASTNDFKILLGAVHSDPVKMGLYPYYTDLATMKPQKDWADHSVSQYGVLGIWACEQAGQEVPSAYWRVVDARWKADQRPDGGWGYKQGEVPKGTMTAAGVATLFITQDYLLQSNSWSVCRGGTRNEHIEKGLAWMDKHVEEMLHGNERFFYGAYGIERIGVASGRKYFGTIDWYRIGADEIVKRQNADGSFGPPGGNENQKKIPDTVFATIFLVRGRAPVLMNKLEYANTGEVLKAEAPGTAVQANAVVKASAPTGAKPEAKPAPAAPPAAKKGGQDEPWNERPRDVANFTQWATKQTEGFLNWQVVNLRVSADDLHDAPILYIAGSEALAFTDPEVGKLREFVEDGGLVLGNADCGNANFTKSFLALGQKMFPKYEFRDLQLTHPIFTDENFRPAKWKVKPRVQGMTNGVRELVLLIPDADVARSWQTRSDRTKPEAYELVENIFLYTISKSEMRFRGETYIVNADPKAPVDKSINVARLEVGDNPDPEPGGWRRLAAILHNWSKLDVALQPVKLGDGKLNGDFKLAHLTGTTKFKLRPEQQKELKDFVAGGGTLVVDAAGGSGEFADSAEQELAATFGGQAGSLGTILEPNNPLYNLGGAKIDAFGYRSFVKGRISGKLNVPRVRAIDVGGRPAVFYSREDLTGGMVGQPTDGILGYTPQTATDIMRNIALFASGNRGAVAKAPDAK